MPERTVEGTGILMPKVFDTISAVHITSCFGRSTNRQGETGATQNEAFGRREEEDGHAEQVEDEAYVREADEKEEGVLT